MSEEYEKMEHLSLSDRVQTIHEEYNTIMAHANDASFSVNPDEGEEAVMVDIKEGMSPSLSDMEDMSEVMSADEVRVIECTAEGEYPFLVFEYEDQDPTKL